MKGYSLLLVLVFLWFKPAAQFNYHSDSTEIIQGVYQDLGNLGTAITTSDWGGASGLPVWIYFYSKYWI
jgi:hypothetical protein